MNNYEYIVSSLPVLRPGAEDRDLDTQAILEDIFSQLSEKDAKTVRFLLKGWDEESLNGDFYREALSGKNRFIREYFAYDLDVRNAKVEYLNRALSRSEGLDVISLGEDAAREAPEGIAEVLSSGDILGRERGLDDSMWRRIDEITVFDTFDLDFILGFIAKLKITERWLRLDPETGKELFRTLVEDIRRGGSNENKTQL